MPEIAFPASIWSRFCLNCYAAAQCFSIGFAGCRLLLAHVLGPVGLVVGGRVGGFRGGFGRLGVAQTSHTIQYTWLVETACLSESNIEWGLWPRRPIMGADFMGAGHGGWARFVHVRGIHQFDLDSLSSNNYFKPRRFRWFTP